MEPYLRPTEIIDYETAQVSQLAGELAAGCTDTTHMARVCFEWVRDHIRHSGDYRAKVTTCRASEVLKERTGWCFAKSHLLAALLRANGIPTGFCYQRLRQDDSHSFTLHGFNAVHLPELGWYRLDPRGNKPGIDTRFDPPREHLAWSAQDEGEIDFPEILADPLPVVVDCLRRNVGFQAVIENLPDVIRMT